MGPTIVIFSCSICGREVAYEELYPPGVPRARHRGPEHPRRRLDRYWHYVSNGDYEGDSELTQTEFEGNVAALTREHPASFLALYCQGCELVYCYDHWAVKYSEDPPRTMGHCPNGHVRVIDW